MRTTHCACCHNRVYEGAGTPCWDLGHAPVWWDSLSDARLRKISDPENSPGQTLPLPAARLAEMRAFVAAEIARREAARAME